MEVYFVESDTCSENIYSQYGEDGVVRKITHDLGLTLGFAMEFGAWDGKHCSNTFALASTLDVLILVEGDKKKFSDLESTAAEYRSIVPVMRFVTATGENSVDSIVRECGLASLDLLSIDIDSYDLEIVENLEMRPKLIIVEFNPTFGALSQYRNETGRAIGNSFMSFYAAMAHKDFSLVATTNTNLFFVDDRVLERAGYSPLRFSNLNLLCAMDKHMFKVACGYDGSRITFGREKHPWDGSRVAKVYEFPKWVYGWEPTYLQVAYRAFCTLRLSEILTGVHRAWQKGWFRFGRK
jgi:hypothetical protein